MLFIKSCVSAFMLRTPDKGLNMRLSFKRTNMSTATGGQDCKCFFDSSEC